MNLCILIPVLVGAICTLLGFFIGKRLGGSNHDECDDRIRRLENSLEDCKKSKAKLDAKIKSVKSTSSSTTSSFIGGAAEIPFDASEAKTIFGRAIKENDLTIVEGIDFKIQELFHNHYIKTWKALSKCTAGKCQQILDSGGEAFAKHNPSTWANQAKMAYEGRWKELIKWHDELNRGT